MQRLSASQRARDAGTTSLGALLRAKLDNKGEISPPPPAGLIPTGRDGHDPFRPRPSWRNASASLTHRDTEFAVKTILDAMSDALARGHRIEIRGFGSFSINRRPPRMGRNRRSGEQVIIPESWCCTSSPARPLRESVDATCRPSSKTAAGRPQLLESPRLRWLESPHRGIARFVWLFKAASSYCCSRLR